MTQQEQQLIDELTERIRSTPATDRDDDADRYLHSRLDAVPDALYVLAQTVLVQQYGLKNAQAQLAEAQDQIDQLSQQMSAMQQAPPQKKSGSFLSHLLGTDQPTQAPGTPPPYAPVNTGYAAAPPPMYGQPVAYPQSGGFGGGGFLSGALQTAAGVAAGEMMFRGMEDLFSGFGGREHLAGGFGGGQPSEVINNNYYGEGEKPEHHFDNASGDNSGFYNPSDDASRQGLSPDIEDRRGFAATDDTDDRSQDNADDRNDFDDSTIDDSNFDDGGTDDTSGNDDGSF